MRFEKGERKFGKRQIQTRVDRVKKHMPYYLRHWMNEMKNNILPVKVSG